MTQTNRYSKKVERWPTGSVWATVLDAKGNSHGSDLFLRGLFESDEQLFKKAHKWADNLITLLEKYETPIT